MLDLPSPKPTHRVAYGPDPNQFGHLWLPGRRAAGERGEAPAPLLIFVHGGYWRARYGLEHADLLCRALAGAGIAVWSIEYRRLGNPGGGYPGTFEDVLRAVDFLPRLAERHPLDLHRVAIMGHSAGGHLALWAAGAHRLPAGHPLRRTDPLPVRAAICVGGITDLRRAWELGLSDGVVEELLGGGPEEVAERYAATSPIELLPLGVPQTLVHGSAEEVVPTEFAERYAAAARAAGDRVRLVWLRDMGHFEPLDPWSAAWPVVYGAVADALGVGSGRPR
ncbi:MAG: alpha/beta hydrolase [Anaerolineae bacterium]|nr:alpha/beta hydrolase [Anaerolineae bacterium]